MLDTQRFGGVAALICAATFVFGLVLLVTVFAPVEGGDAGDYVAFLVNNQFIAYLWNLVIYVVFGVFLVALSLALYARLQCGARGLVQGATVFGLIWAGLVIASGMVSNVGASAVTALYTVDPGQAETAWLAIDTVRNGLGGGNEIVGGLWIALLSWAAVRAGGLPKLLAYFGLVVGAAGLLSTIPPLGELSGLVFGLGSIVWFAWIGIVMLRDTHVLTE